MFGRFIKRLIVVIVLLLIAYSIYSYINPQGASNFVEKIKSIFPDKKNSKDDEKSDLIISGYNTSIVTGDITKNSSKDKIVLNYTGTNQNVENNTENSDSDLFGQFTQILEDDLNNAIPTSGLSSTGLIVNNSTGSIVVNTGSNPVLTGNVVFTGGTTTVSTNSTTKAVNTTSTVKTVSTKTTTSATSVGKLNQKDINDAKNLLNNIIQ